MKILEFGKNEVKCDHCGAKLQYTANDIRWSHTEPTYYYVVCPVCHTVIWLEATEELNNMWKEKCK